MLEQKPISGSAENRWALLIGIDRYHESLGSLKYAGADCRALRDTLVSGPLAFPEDQVLVLDDAGDGAHRPTFANIHQSLSSWLAVPREDDLVLVFFAGHGRLVDGTTYLVPGDATLGSIHTLGIPLRNVQDVIDRCKAQRKLLVLDACHSGAGRDVCTMAGGMRDAIAQGTGFYTISSCGADESSHEWDDKGRGVFSHFLTEALQGACPPAADGCLTADRIYDWVHEHVAKWAAQHRCSQTPQRFSKGAGALVLTRTNPDHAALAEQYRRELNQAQARLAELELREARERIAHEEQRNRAAHSRKWTSGSLARARAAMTQLPWPFWLFVSLVLPLTCGIAAWASVVNGTSSDDVRLTYGLVNGALAVGFGLLVAFGGREFKRWGDAEAAVVGCTGGALYGMAVLEAGFFWPIALALPLSAFLFVCRSLTQLLLLMSFPLSCGIAAWAHVINGTSSNDMRFTYGLINAALAVGFGLLVALGGRELKGWSDGRAAVVGCTAGALYGMSALGAGFLWPIAFASLPLAALAEVPSENRHSTPGQTRASSR